MRSQCLLVRGCIVMRQGKNESPSFTAPAAIEYVLHLPPRGPLVRYRKRRIGTELLFGSTNRQASGISAFWRTKILRYSFCRHFCFSSRRQGFGLKDRRGSEERDREQADGAGKSRGTDKLSHQCIHGHS